MESRQKHSLTLGFEPTDLTAMSEHHEKEMLQFEKRKHRFLSQTFGRI